jgi:hypothetical protein
MVTCATCAHAVAWITATGYVTGFVSCALRPAYEYRAPRLACAFDPSRYLPRQELNGAHCAPRVESAAPAAVFQPQTGTQLYTMKVSELSTSKYLKQGDISKPQVVTVTTVSKENVSVPGEPKKERGVIYFREFEKGMVLNTTNLRRLEQLYGGDTDLWVDQKVVLYVDQEVTYGGEQVGGLRLRKLPKPAPKRAAEPAGHFDDMPDDVPWENGLGEQA